MDRGLFATFESIDGLGKTTQFKLLGAALKNLGFSVFMTKEPGDTSMGSNIGAGIRELVFKNPTTLKMRPGVADMLFLADHVQTSGDVAEHVAKGDIVLCDRYADSQFAYAASPTKQCPEWALRYYREQYGIEPDITILLLARGPQVIQGFTPTHANLDSNGEYSITGRVDSFTEDISWALGRAKGRQGGEAGKQDGKAWNSVEEQRKIQDAYWSQIEGLPRTVPIHVYESDSVESIHEQILDVVLRRIRVAPEPGVTATEASSDYAPL
jgi:dTMP kinase